MARYIGARMEDKEIEAVDTKWRKDKNFKNRAQWVRETILKALSQ